MPKKKSKKGYKEEGMHKMPSGMMMSDKEMKQMMLKKKMKMMARKMMG